MAVRQERLSPLEPFGDAHDASLFDCGEPALDGWLVRRARASQATGHVRVFVICRAGFVVGYHCLTAGAVMAAPTTTATAARGRRNTAEPVPVVVLRRLAVDRSLHGHGIGRALLRDAIRRILPAARAIGARCLLAPTLGEGGRGFYLACGLVPVPRPAIPSGFAGRNLRQVSPGEPTLLMAPLDDVVAALG